MTILTRNNELFSKELAPWFVGFEQLFDDFNMAEVKYPPFNLIQKDNNHYVIEMAVAGFSSEDISVITENGILKISAKKITTEENESTNKYVYRGLASRGFKQEFRLCDYTVVSDVHLVNGILTVFVERRLPEHLTEQKFTISTNK